MVNLTAILDEIKFIRDTPLGSSKSAVLVQYKDNEEVKQFLYWLLSPSIVFNLKQVQNPGVTGDNSVTFVEFETIVHKLIDSNINDSLRKEVSQFIGRFTNEYQDLLKEFFTKKLKLGVSTPTVNKVFPNLIPEFKCMLAEATDVIRYPAYVELKYDGVRCIAQVKGKECTLYTRHGNKIDLPEIAKHFVLLANNNEYAFDCELITEARTDVSGKINSIMKSGYSSVKSEGIIAKVFDIIPLQEFLNDEQVCKIRLENRKYLLSMLFMKYSGNLLSYGEIFTAENEQQARVLVNKFINDGEEGAIIKPLDSYYWFKRSTEWGKFKAINSATLKVVGATSGSGARAGQVGALICVSECEKIMVNVGSGLTKEDLTNLNDSIVGRYVEVLFNTVIDSKNSDEYSLFLPRLKANDWLRIDKTEADTLDKILAEHIGKPLISK